MLTKAKHKQGEGTLNTFNLKVGCVSKRKKMAKEDNRDEQKKNIHMVFYRMSEMVKQMYEDYEKRMKNKGKKKEAHADDDASVNQWVGGDPPEPPSSPSSSSSSSSEHSHHSHHSSHKVSFKKPLLKLDVKFYLPMFNGDVNPEKIDNWI
jgi:phosphoenolpyruvate carboxylase